MRRITFFLLLLAVAAFTSGAAVATPLLSETVYICSSGCPQPVQNAGPVPVDASAVVGHTDTVALAPAATVAGDVMQPGLRASAQATAVLSAPPTFRLLGQNDDLAVDGTVVAVLYWEDDLTLTAPGFSIGAPLRVTPTLSFDGALALVAGSGSVGWSFAMAFNTDSFLGAGGFCMPGFSPGPVDCTPTGFGTASQDRFVANGVAFNM